MKDINDFYDSLPVIGQISICIAFVVTVPIWFPFWVLQELKQGRIEKKIEQKLDDQEAVEKIFQNIRKDLK